MAKLPNQKKLRKEDIPDSPDWFGVVIDVMNSFMESVYFALNKQITFNDNIACQIKDINFTTSSIYSTGLLVDFGKLQFTHTLKTKPQGLFIMQLTQSNNAPIIKTVSCDWNQEGGLVYINYISGLEDSTTYNLRVMVF